MRNSLFKKFLLVFSFSFSFHFFVLCSIHTHTHITRTHIFNENNSIFIIEFFLVALPLDLVNLIAKTTKSQTKSMPNKCFFFLSFFVCFSFLFSALLKCLGSVLLYGQHTHRFAKSRRERWRNIGTNRSVHASGHRRTQGHR